MLSRLRSLLGLAVSAEPHNANGVIVNASGALLGSAMAVAIMHRALARSAMADFLDREALESLFAVQVWIFLPGFAAFLVAGLLARKRWPDTRLLAHGVFQFNAAIFGVYSYVLGHHTSPFGAFGLFFSVAIGGLVFEARIVLAGIISFAVIVLATTIAEQMGSIPYAPLFAQPPFEAGHLSPRWLIASGPVLINMLIAAFFFLLVMQVGRERERKLQRATEVIRRYVPAQLAEKILAGDHTGTAQPERRKVTLFFSDVVGFTNSADQMEPEDLASLLNEYLSEMSEIAHDFGATVNQFVGDGIMIFFGAPEATTDQDHALRAVRMSLAMQRRMAELGEKWFAEGIQTPFRIRVGINTGMASVGDFGSEDRTTYSAIGNQTNLTVRIQDHCEPGKVLISHTTWALVKDEIACQERGEIEVKGLHYPVRVYEVAQGASLDARDA